MYLSLSSLSICLSHSVFVLFTFMSILFYVYLALGTTYVLIIDMGFGLIGVFFAIIEFFFGLVAYI